MTIARAAAVVLAIAAGVLGVWRGTWAVGGSDSSCYALMAQALAGRQWQPVSTLTTVAGWPNAHATLAPAGFVPSPVAVGAASPVCAPGFSLVLALFYALGGADAIFLVTPISGALLVYVTFLFGVRVAGEWSGLAAAAMVWAAPTFVFQLVQPMNDVFAAMLWMAIAWLVTGERQRPGTLGIVTGFAILVRPNLVAAAIVVALCVLWRTRRHILRFGLSAAPSLAVLLAWNTALYGHAFGSGYGDVAGLFAVSHLAGNIRNYSDALWDTQLALPLLGCAALAFAPRERRIPVVIATAVAAALAVVYLFYRPFQEWWYLRFMLPALAILTVLAAAAIVFITRRSWPLLPVVIIVCVHGAMSPAMRDALALSRFERRFRSTAEVVRERLPVHAVAVTVWESGSVRYHAKREAVLWDAIEPAALSEVIEGLAAAGREPVIIVEDWEEPLFRRRFASHSLLGRLDWPPRFDIERRVRIYRPADRADYWSGRTVPTEFVRPDR